MKVKMDISQSRRSYTHARLRREDLTSDPLELFTLWMKEACEAKLADPTGMVIATVDEAGQPFQRSVLLKQFDERGFVFFTNLGSRKAQQIAHNNKISLLFPWYDLDRQVAVTGNSERLPTLDVLKYFRTRPRDSQIGAYISEQSSRISARKILEAKFLEMKKKFSEGEIPLPSFWGGYRIIPHSIEFWQGQPNRLHDRFLYEREGEGWHIERLSP